MSIHHCHARGCDTPVPPRLLMCLKHWRMVPQALKRAVWATYRQGQEIDKKPSREYIAAARAAIDAVWQCECPHSNNTILHEWSSGQCWRIFICADCNLRKTALVQGDNP